MLDPVMWSSCDNHSTTCHGGHLISHPPCRQTWALRVPTLISCYFGLVYVIDAPCRLQDRWIHMLSPSWIGCWVYAPCIFALALSPISLMQTAALATDSPHSVFQLSTSLTGSRSCAL